MADIAAAPTSVMLGVALVLFLIGMAGVMIRRDLLYVLMSLEIMFNGAALAFVTAAAKWKQPDGQVMVILILVAAAGRSRGRAGAGASPLSSLRHG